MISVVIPIYNEEEILHLLHSEVSGVMEKTGEEWEVVYVNDGSRDTSLKLLRELQAEDPHVVVVDLSRNWGHMGALWAGMQTARGSALVLMDGDLQDPPRVILDLVAAWRKGAEVVVVYRRERKDMPAIEEETEAAEKEGALPSPWIRAIILSHLTLSSPASSKVT
jgi:dolichol-phosphate mannosyltransferase